MSHQMGLPAPAQTSESTSDVEEAVILELTCDGDHGLLPVLECFVHEDGTIEQYAAAMRAGWKEHNNSHGRLFFCPQCSGKKPRT